MEETRKAAKLRIAQCLKEIEDGAGFKCEVIDEFGVSTAAKYLSVKDKVTKYVQPAHNWFPKIIKIEEIINPALQINFERAKLKCFGNHIDQKFHGTSEVGNQNIPKDGFLFPKAPPPGKLPGMYGQGIYFATDSSKSAQEIYTKGSGKLLLCDVLLGKSKRVERSDPSLTLEKIRKEGFDSVFAPRDTKGTGGVMNDEFVIFNPHQALPRYIIRFQNTGGHHGLATSAAITTPAPTPLSLKLLGGPSFHRIQVLASRIVDPNDLKQGHFDRAVTKFFQVTTKISLHEKFGNLHFTRPQF